MTTKRCKSADLGFGAEFIPNYQRHPNVFVYSILALLGLSIASIEVIPCAAEFAGFPIQQETTIGGESKKLIAELANKDHSIRDEAGKRLREIGLRALEALYEAETSSDLAIREQSAKLVKAIRDANGLPTRVNGVEFKLIVDSEWRVPAEGQSTDIKLELEVTNKTKKELFLQTHNVVNIIMMDEKGQALPTQGSSKAVKNLVDPNLALNPSVTMSFKAKLVHSPKQEGEFGLVCTDRFSRHWAVTELTKGNYSISVIYEKRPLSPGETWLWTGKSETVPNTVVIK